MKKINIILIILLIVGSLSVFGCIVDPVNTPPDVNAGPDDQVDVNADYQLQGVVSDDNIPLDGQLTSQWSVVSGQSSFQFQDDTNPTSSVVFFEAGTYTLRLIASDGELQNSDEVTILVEGKDTPVFEPGVWVEAEDGVLSGGMSEANGDGQTYIVAPEIGSADASASFTFDVLEAGTYRLNTKVFALDGESDSFFVGLDSQDVKGNENMIWDAQRPTPWIEDYVNWRGVSDPTTWNLQGGENTFVFFGRESNTKLDKIKLEKVSVVDCVKGDWVDDSCGAGSCNDDEMRQTRTVNPANCDITQQCVVTSECGSSGDKIITDVLFDWDTHYRDAINADLWPMTWGADGRVWTSWGDGSGFPYEFNREEKVTIGFAYFEGIPGTNSFKGVNVWGGENPIYPIQDEWDCPHECGKVGSLLSVNGVLYAFYSPWTSKYDEPIASKRKQLHRSQIMYSTNNGETWQVTDWYYDNLNVPFFPHGFLNFGQDYAGARDNYVYMYGSDWRSSATYTDVFLARVPKDKILDKNAYEYFSGTSNSPAWSKNMYDRKKVLYEPKEIGAFAVIYNKGLDRYIMTGHNTDYMGKWTIYEAPEPWGPWKIVKQYDDWHGTGDVHAGMGHSFPTKWISEDGTEMWMTFSGSLYEGEEWDSFNMIKVTFELDGDSNEIFEVNDIRANQPKNFRLTSSGDDVTLRWDWNENAPVSAFKIYRSETGNEPWVRPSGGKFYDPSARSFVDNNLEVGKKYHYIVQAVHGNPEVNSLISQDKQIIVGNGEPDDAIPSPTNVKASYDGNTITVTWDYEPKAGVSLGGFKIDKSYEYGSWERPDGGRIVNTNARSFVDEPNLPSGVYIYRVFGWYLGNNYPFSESVAIKID